MKYVLTPLLMCTAVVFAEQVLTIVALGTAVLAAAGFGLVLARCFRRGAHA